MKISSITRNVVAPVAIILTTISPYNHVQGFSIVSITRPNNAPSVVLYGLLDEVMSEASSSSSSLSTSSASSEQQYEDLFHSLILSTDTRKNVSLKLNACSEPEFVQYLTSSKENSNDDEERQGLGELLELIQDVQKEQALQQEQQINAIKEKEKKRAEQDASAKLATKESFLSTADVLKEANNINTAVMDDDEKPSDFISDCREVANLSGGFSNQGRMSVGGR